MDCPSPLQYVSLADKYSLYLQHFENIADTTKTTDKAMLEGKFKQLSDSSILLLSAFFIDILDPAKIFSLASQKEDFNIIDMIDRLDDMIFSYENFETVLIQVCPP